MREVSQEVDTIAPQEESHPTGTIELPPPPPTDSTAKRMFETVKTTMGTQEQPTSNPYTALAEDIEAYLANMVTRGCQVVISTQAHTLETMVKELEQVLSFMRVDCPTVFTVCFEARGWPNTNFEDEVVVGY